jgi:hypothetical protein
LADNRLACGLLSISGWWSALGIGSEQQQGDCSAVALLSNGIALNA